MKKVQQMSSNVKLGFVGAGNMAEAIARGVIGSGMIPAADIYACDPSEERQKVFAEMGVNVSADISTLNECSVILLAVKPQIMFDAVKPLKGSTGPDKLIITIAAGITTESLAAALDEGTRIVRVMPNTPMLVGQGMSGVCKGNNATDTDLEFVVELCSSAGKANTVTEDLMNAVTAVSGSGPAYVFLFTELLEKAAVALGIPAEAAGEFARQTCIGSARLLEQSPDSATELRRKVTSPKGTTEAAINSMLEQGLEELMCKAVKAAHDRGVELAAGK